MLSHDALVQEIHAITKGRFGKNLNTIKALESLELLERHIDFVIKALWYAMSPDADIVHEGCRSVFGKNVVL